MCSVKFSEEIPQLAHVTDRWMKPQDLISVSTLNFLKSENFLSLLQKCFIHLFLYVNFHNAFFYQEQIHIFVN